MSEQWYCPNCGILHEDVVDPIRSPAGLEEDEYFECRECGEVIDQNNPPFVTALLARAEAAEADVDAMVNRFLCWKLPRDFGPDGGITFCLPWNIPDHFWPTGTNLFTAEQAKAMIEHMLGGEHE